MKIDDMATRKFLLVIPFIVALALISMSFAQEEDERGICTWEPVRDPICTESEITYVNYCFAYNQTIIHNGTCIGHEEFWQ
jgi:hypothetical protein